MKRRMCVSEDWLGSKRHGDPNSPQTIDSTCGTSLSLTTVAVVVEVMIIDTIVLVSRTTTTTLMHDELCRIPVGADVMFLQRFLRVFLVNNGKKQATASQREALGS